MKLSDKLIAYLVKSEEWSWIIYFVLLPICVAFSMFSRGAINAQNVARHGRDADYKKHPLLAIIGSLFGGGVWADQYSRPLLFFFYSRKVSTSNFGH